MPQEQPKKLKKKKKKKKQKTGVSLACHWLQKLVVKEVKLTSTVQM